MAEYLSAVATHWWALVTGAVAGALWLFGLVGGKDREDLVMTRLRPWFGLLAFMLLSCAQYLVWKDARHDLNNAGSTMAAQEATLDRLELQRERERGAAESKMARLEGRADVVEEQRTETRRLFEEERGRSEALQDELRRQAVEAARRPVEIESWIEEGVRLAGSRTLPPPAGEKLNVLQLIFHTGTPRSTVAIRLTCTCRLDRIEGSYSTLPSGVYLMNSGIDDSGHVGWVSISQPAFEPEAALLVRVYSPEDISITEIELLQP